MKMNDNMTTQQAAALAHLYMDGGTSRSQEKALARFLAEGGILPDELSEVADMLMWLEGSPEIEPLKLPTPVKRKFGLKLIWAVGVAASIALIATIGIGLSNRQNDSNNDNPYTVAFAMIDGKKVTDMHIIQPLIDEMNRKMEEMEEMEASETLEMPVFENRIPEPPELKIPPVHQVVEIPEIEVVQPVDPDAYMESAKQRFLESITDPHTRALMAEAIAMN